MRGLLLVVLASLLSLLIFSQLGFVSFAQPSESPPVHPLNLALEDSPGDLPLSAIIASPQPVPPNTTPTVVTLAAGAVCRPECTISGSFAAPSGSWAMILLNYTGGGARERFRLGLLSFRKWC